MSLRHRVESLRPSTLLVITAVLVALTVGWTVWRADQAEDTAKQTAKTEVSKAKKKADFKVDAQADRIGVLEDYVTLCREQPKQCQKVVPPVEDIEPKVTIQRQTIQPSQVLSAVRTLLPAGIAQFCADDRCDGDDGTNGQNGISPPPPADGKDGVDGTDGQDAPTITAITCTGMTPTTFTYTFSDGTELIVECEMLPPVDEP
jgi:hypothetical protein